MTPLVRGKLRPMIPPDFVVERSRFAPILDGVWERAATLVVAPAGYGKSTLLSQWVHAHHPQRLAWLTVDERDVDPVRFGSHLIAALGEVCPSVGSRSRRALGAVTGAMGAEFVELLVDELDALDADTVLVLEDLDRLSGGPIMEDLARLTIELPPALHLVIISRVDPSIGLHRLRSRDEVAEIRAADLRFTRHEAASVVTRLAGLDLTDDEVTHLLEITEGWPVAVQLAAVSLRNGAHTSVLDFGATDRHIVDYLSAELLQRASDRLRSFLLDVSVLQTMNAELCDAVTGRDDGARMLAELEQRALFVTPVPSEFGWWRQHRLVREFLLGDLRQTAPQRAGELQRRAAAWYLRHDDAGQAAGYLVEAGAWDELLDLVDAHGRSLWDQGYAATLHQLVESVPAAVRRRSTRTQLVDAAVRLVACRPEAAAVALAELSQRQGLTAGETVLVDALRCALVFELNPTPALVERADAALASLAELSPDDVPVVLESTSFDDTTMLLQCSTALARALLGDGAAVDHAARALDTPPSTRSTFRVNAHGMLAWFDALRWRPTTAAAHAAHAVDLAEHRLGPDHVATVFALAGRVVAARMANDVETASVLAGDALEISERWNRWPMASFVLAEQALLSLATGDLDAATERVQRARRRPLAPMVDGRLQAVELRIRIARGELGGAWPGIDTVGSASRWELAAAAVAAAVQAQDPGRARKYLDRWPVTCAPFGEPEHELATVLVDHAEGDTATAQERLTALLGRTAPEGVVQPYLDAGDPVVQLLGDSAPDRPRAHVESIVRLARAARREAEPLVDPLSAREIEVLAHLPTRLSNAQIADQLYVSTNTVKTHIKHIYQKLAATDRDDAIRRARDLGLLSHAD